MPQVSVLLTHTQATKQSLSLKGSLTLNSIIENWSAQSAALEEKGPGGDRRGHDKCLGHIRHALCDEVTGPWGRVSDLRGEGLRLSKETLSSTFLLNGPSGT